MSSSSVSRRRFLSTGAALVGGAVGGAVVGAGVATAVSAGDDPAETPFGPDVVAFHGPHQPGIATPQQAHTWFVGLDLADAVDLDAARRLLRLWTDDASRLMSGTAPLADQEKELATSPARLTVTLGLGPGFFSRLGLDARRPPSLRPIPDLAIDRLDPRWRQTDLLLQVGSDDVLAVSHAVRILTRDARSFVTPVWVQRGFLHARGSRPAGTTPRNLMGQVDGTVNPDLATDAGARVVWAEDGPAWWRGGAMLVLRRIRMELDTWERLGRSDRELVIGRRLVDGAPLTGGDERTAVDLDAVGADGLLVVPEFAHVRHARARDDSERMLRRGYTYDDTGQEGTAADAGLIFAAYVADVDRQYLPVQRRLVGPDLLNRWTTPIGSGVYALPPGCAPGGVLCAGLLDG